MKVLYLDKKERARAWLTPVRLVALACGLLFLLFAPIWPDTISGRFILEPAQRAVIRAEVPGRVEQVLAQEGAVVSAGTPLLKLRNLDLESEAALARANLEVANARATQAELHYASFGAADRERQQLAERSRNFAEEIAKLQVVSPIAGVIVTPRLQDLVGAYVKEGTVLAEVNGLSTMYARIFVPEVAIQYLHMGQRADVKLDSIFRPVSGRVVAIAPATSAMTEGLVPKEKYFEGFRQPQYYAAILELPSNGFLRAGMPGTGKIQTGRRSLTGFVWRLVHDSVGRKLW